VPGYELGSRGTELIWQLQNNGKKAIRRRKEDYVCCNDSETDKSVARTRLVKTENTSTCVTVNCKVCRPAIAL
jgi:hypothetical protein